MLQNPMFTEVEKEPCQQKEKTGKWLDPAYVKKKRKTFDIKSLTSFLENFHSNIL